MQIKARILADSIGPAGVRLTTWELTYHRYMHAELMTYGMFSRNAASSRAIPVKKMRDRIRKNPAMPVAWGMNQPGMQAGEELQGWRRKAAIWAWLLGCYCALFVSWLLLKLNVHKQITNRVTEPWMFITTIVTADEYALANMWHQRDHKDAQPEFRVLARLMWVEYNLHQPQVLKIGEWHLPFIQSADVLETVKKHSDVYFDANTSIDPIKLIHIAEAMDCDMVTVMADLKAVSVGRCARVSYLTHDGKRDLNEDIKLHDKMKNSNPGHWSPFEHIAQALAIPATQAKLHGWTPYRMTFKNEFLNELPKWNPLDYMKEIHDSIFQEDDK